MKVFVISCSSCMREATAGGLDEDDAKALPVFLPGRMDDTGVVFVSCPNGHKSVVRYNHRRHEVLFASGTNAFLDGYLNEAVSTMAASLERAFEFFIRVVWRKHGLKPDEIDAGWKAMAKQSERQLGAFCALWLVETSSAFPVDSKQSGFRNDVVHKGKIPEQKNVVAFADYVFDRVRMIVHQLEDSALGEMKSEIAQENLLQAKAVPAGTNDASMAELGVFSFGSYGSWVDHVREIRGAIDATRQAAVRRGE